jgi:hypothetical protein
MKRPDFVTSILLLGAVGYGVQIVEDEKALRLAKKEAKNRKLHREKSVQWRNAKKLRMLHEEAVRRGKLGASARMNKTTPEQRTRSARKAAKARWRKPRLVEITPRAV